MARKISEQELEQVKDYLVGNILRNPNVMFCDNVRNDEYDYAPDLVEVIVALFELLHIEVTGKEYDYMWHWANKIGSWVDTNTNIFYNTKE